MQLGTYLVSLGKELLIPTLKFVKLTIGGRMHLLDSEYENGNEIKIVQNLLDKSHW